MEMTLSFNDCFYNTDLERFKKDLKDSGATVINNNFNYEKAVAIITVEVEEGDFIDRFQRTRSFGFTKI